MTYTAFMSLINKVKRNFIFLAIIGSIALSLCPIDALFPMSETARHDPAAHYDCIPNLCATITAKETFSPENDFASFSWLSLALILSFIRPLNPDLQNALLRFNGKKNPQKFTSKLYRLHAAFLI